MLRCTHSLVLGAIFVVVTPCIGWTWGDVGHHIVAAIAYERLTAEARNFVDEVTAKHPDLWSKNPDVRFTRIDTLPPGHDDEAPKAEDLYPIGFDVRGRSPGSVGTPNLVSEILVAYERLLNAEATRRYDAGVAEYLQKLMHKVGDIHTPVHCMTFRSNDFPYGDRAGFDYSIRLDGARRRLHAFWDEVPNSLVGPQDDSATAVRATASLLLEDPTLKSPSAGGVTNAEIESWATETFELHTRVYFDPPGSTTMVGHARDGGGSELSSAYLDDALTVTRGQLRAAGIRLAVILNAISASPPAPTPLPTPPLADWLLKGLIVIVAIGVVIIVIVATMRKRDRRSGRDVRSVRSMSPTDKVFLSYNFADVGFVEDLLRRLKKAGVPVWSSSEIRPGDSWQAELAKVIEDSNSYIVCFGREGLGKWQSVEVDQIITMNVEKKRRVIPIILPGVAKGSSLPLQLNRFHAIDFRIASPDPFEALLFGITGASAG